MDEQTDTLVEEKETLPETEELSDSSIDQDDFDESTDRDQMCLEFSQRADFYRMIEKFFDKPYTQDELNAMDWRSLKELSEETENELLADGFNDMYRYLRKSNTGTCSELAADFTRCFLGTATFCGMAGMPYASLYLSAGGELMAEPRKQVRAVYKQHCFKLAEGIDLPEDHLSFECEFMALMNENCYESLSAGDIDQAREYLDVQRSFLEEHILTWVNRFFLLASELIRTRFYKGVLKVTEAFFEEELPTIEFLDSELVALSQAEKSK